MGPAATGDPSWPKFVPGRRRLSQIQVITGGLSQDAAFRGFGLEPGISLHHVEVDTQQEV